MESSRKNKAGLLCLRITVYILPFILGAAGLIIQEKHSVSESLFQSLLMYFLNYGDEVHSPLVEVARWTAPLVTASWIVSLLKALRTQIKERLAFAFTVNSTAVYGPEKEQERLIATADFPCLAGKEEFLLAHRYILLGSESENFTFLKEHQRKLDGKEVYLKATSIRGLDAASPHTHIFCYEELTARNYWKSHILYDALSKDRRLRIVLLGWNMLAEYLILYGLNDNVYFPDQHIEYHVYGDPGDFKGVYHEIGHIQDPVIFHTEPWYEDEEVLEKADLLLLTQQTDQTRLIRRILQTFAGKKMAVFASVDLFASYPLAQKCCEIIDWQKEACTAENILSDRIYEQAKRINLRYAHIYSQVEETEENKEKEWAKLDSFTRYSNVASADYHETRLHIMESLGWSMDLSGRTHEQLEYLSMCEHERWYRYHILNNWKYGVPASGKAKDPEKRIHIDLLPYRQLPEAEKQKDRDTIQVLMEMDWRQPPG